MHVCLFVVVRVYIGDLGNNGDPDELRRMFARYGSVQDVWVAHKPPGFAFIFYKTVREAREAVKGADGRVVCGVRVRVRMGTDVNQLETHHRGRSFEREYEQPQRDRSRGGSSYQSRNYHQQTSSRGPRHSDRIARDYEERSPPPRAGWSSRGSHRSISHSHPSSMGHGYSSKLSYTEDLYSLPSSSHSKYGGHKRNYEPFLHHSPGDRYSYKDGYTSRDGSRITSRYHHTSPEYLPRFSPSAHDMDYKRGSDRFEHREVQQYGYKDKATRSGGGEYRTHVSYPKISSHHHHQHHRSRSPHSFSPPPIRQQHNRKHGNKGMWGHDSYSPSPRHYDDNHDDYHHSWESRDEQYEAHSSFSKDRGTERGSRKDYMFDGRAENRYGSKKNEHSYKSADREVKYRGRQRFSRSERYSGQVAEYHEGPFIRQEFAENDRSDRGSSLEGVGIDDEKFSDVRIVERDPNDLRRKLLSEADSEREVREASPSERG